MLVINVTYNVKEGHREEYYNKIKVLRIDQLSREEEGNIKYEYFFSPEDYNQVFLLEQWEDQEAFEVHKSMAHFSVLQDLKAEYVDSTTIEVYNK